MVFAHLASWLKRLIPRSLLDLACLVHSLVLELTVALKATCFYPHGSKAIEDVMLHISLAIQRRWSCQSLLQSKLGLYNFGSLL